MIMKKLEIFLELKKKKKAVSTSSSSVPLPPQNHYAHSREERSIRMRKVKIKS